MTTALWTKISLGAVGVFATGMMGITAFRHARTATEHAVADAVSSVVQEAAAAVGPVRTFRLNGRELGKLTTFSIQRAEWGKLPEAALEVTLNDPAFQRELARCDLMPIEGANPDDIDIEQGFRCATQAERPLTGVGTVRFSPGGVVRPILVSHRLEAELRQGEPFEVRGTVDGQVQVVARDGKGSLVKIRADSTGAMIHVNDEFGRSLLRLLADSSGAALRIRDKHGREVVRLDAGDGSFSLTVDTAGH